MLVAISGGTNVLTCDFFEFEWSATSDTLSVSTCDVVEITVGDDDISVNVIVS